MKLLSDIKKLKKAYDEEKEKINIKIVEFEESLAGLEIDFNAKVSTSSTTYLMYLAAEKCLYFSAGQSRHPVINLNVEEKKKCIGFFDKLLSEIAKKYEEILSHDNIKTSNKKEQSAIDSEPTDGQLQKPVRPSAPKTHKRRKNVKSSADRAKKDTKTTTV